MLCKLQPFTSHYTPKIYTDESYTTKYDFRIDQMHLEPGYMETCASVIIMNASPDWPRLPVIGLRITGNEIAADSAYII